MINPRLKAYTVPLLADGDVSTGTSHWFMLQMVGSGKRVLEFGCASGYMSGLMKAAGCHVTGVEIDVDAAETARASCDELIVADLDIQPLVDIVPDVAYDVLVFGDVLEHLRDPWRLLDESRRFIAPGGFAVISIPNVAHGSIRLKLLQGEFEYTELGLLDDTHLRFFTLKTVEELCLRSGYRLDAIERTKVALFEDTPLTPPSKEMLFDPELIDQIRRDPEHDTLQFIVRATPLSDDEKFAALAKELATVRDRLRLAETSARLSQEAYDEVEADLEARERAGRIVIAGDVTRMSLATIDESDSRRPVAGRPARGKTISARAIKRAEALAAANELATAALAAADARNVELEVAIDELRQAQAEFARASSVDATSRIASSTQENESLKAALRTVRDKYADVRQAHAQCAANDAENVAFRKAMEVAIRRFVGYAEAELATVRGRISEMDAAIAGVQSSKMWRLKRALGKFRR